jgi:hypothetical protein
MKKFPILMILLFSAILLITFSEKVSAYCINGTWSCASSTIYAVCQNNNWDNDSNVCPSGYSCNSTASACQIGTCLYNISTCTAWSNCIYPGEQYCLNIGCFEITKSCTPACAYNETTCPLWTVCAGGTQVCDAENCGSVIQSCSVNCTDTINVSNCADWSPCFVSGLRYCESCPDVISSCSYNFTSTEFLNFRVIDCPSTSIISGLSEYARHMYMPAINALFPLLTPGITTYMTLVNIPQGNIQTTATNNTFLPVSGATVTIEGMSQISDSQGYGYFNNLPAGTYLAKIQLGNVINYNPITTPTYPSYMDPGDYEITVNSTVIKTYATLCFDKNINQSINNTVNGTSIPIHTDISWLDNWIDSWTIYKKMIVAVVVIIIADVVVAIMVPSAILISIISVLLVCLFSVIGFIPIWIIIVLAILGLGIGLLKLFGGGGA